MRASIGVFLGVYNGQWQRIYNNGTKAYKITNSINVYQGRVIQIAQVYNTGQTEAMGLMTVFVAKGAAGTMATNTRVLWNIKPASLSLDLYTDDSYIYCVPKSYSVGCFVFVNTSDNIKVEIDESVSIETLTQIPISLT